MSTVCKICVNAGQDEVARCLREFLASRSTAFDESASEWPEATGPGNFNPDYSFPTILSLKQVTDDVTEVYYNSFGDVETIAAAISAQLNAPVVVNSYQSTAMAAEWALFSGGELRRKVSAEGGEVTSNDGQLLDFEGDHAGRDISEEEDEGPIFAFDDSDMSDYNNRVGIGIGVYHDGGSGWVNLRAQDMPVADGDRPWWKFW